MISGLMAKANKVNLRTSLGLCFFVNHLFSFYSSHSLSVILYFIYVSASCVQWHSHISGSLSQTVKSYLSRCNKAVGRQSEEQRINHRHWWLCSHLYHTCLQSPKAFLESYEEMLLYTQREETWPTTKMELEGRGVSAFLDQTVSFVFKSHEEAFCPAKHMNL